MTLDYHAKKIGKSWNISIGNCHITFGFGARLVTDRLIPHSNRKKVCNLTHCQNLTDRMALTVVRPTINPVQVPPARPRNRHSGVRNSPGHAQ